VIEKIGIDQLDQFLSPFSTTQRIPSSDELAVGCAERSPPTRSTEC
jgi:hypothetical protein